MQARFYRAGTPCVIPDNARVGRTCIATLETGRKMRVRVRDGDLLGMVVNPLHYIKNDTEPKTFSRHEVEQFKRCPRLWAYRYGVGLETRGFYPAMLTGSLFHKAVQTGEASIPAVSAHAAELLAGAGIYDADEANLAIYRASAMAMAYLQWPERVPLAQAEKTFTMPVKKFFFTGRIDGINDLGQIVEFKTASRIDENYFYRLSFDFQISAYSALVNSTSCQIPEVIYLVAQKPGIIKTKKENWEEHYARLQRWYVENPNALIKRVFRRSESEIAAFHRDLELTLASWQRMRPWGFYKNHAACLTPYSSCEYLRLCAATNEIEFAENMNFYVKTNPEVNTDEIAQKLWKGEK